MNKKPLVLIIILAASCCFAGQLSSENVKKILDKTTALKIAGIKLLEKEDLKISYYKKEHKRNADIIYQWDIKAMNDNIFRSYLLCDFNSNGKMDIAISCIDKNKNKSYLVIVEKVNNDYKYITHFTFQTRRVFIFVNKKRNVNYCKNLTICFQYGTDWCETIKWKSGKYIIVEDPYGP